ALSAAAKAAGDGAGAPVVVAQVDPITLGVVRSPGECGVDVAVGEGQPLGNRLDFGGPSFGLFAAREEYLRRMPGRIAGETTDVDGRRGFVLTLQTREQHIRREKATSNICTAQALNALGGVVYLSWLGRSGIVEIGELMAARAHYARETLAALPGIEQLHSGPVVREFALRLDGDVAAIRERCAAAGLNPGADLHALTGRAEDRGGLLVAITERRSREDIDRLAEVLGEAVAAERRRCAAEGVNPGVDVHALSGREHDRGVLLVAITEKRSRAEIDKLVDVLGRALAAERSGGGDGAEGGATAGAAGAGNGVGSHAERAALA
ncbi:MAG TPA: hypothetical protein VG188_04185, partial [Solirubrobacteraceae bacterium]|nr:hypothetical protein [Solirubrobacteraceae bacterium]